ncbi:MAG: purine-nucleoside phosphorylase [Saprospiraceae bacterium]|nr:purine-nucleoside phosphorylase [Saprospiraceae bacterium]
MTLRKQIDQGCLYLRQILGQFQPSIGIILGSGFAHFTDSIDVLSTVPYGDIPGFPLTSVEGHDGHLKAGKVQDINILAMQGRPHFYEGHSMQSLSIPVRIMKSLGIGTLIITNAAGAINPIFRPGELMIIHDHINLSFTNPLLGPNLSDYGPRFPDTSTTYDPVLISAAHDVAKGMNLNVRDGVYLFTSGPSYETPAEVRMMKKMGADVVGMSTFPEALTAKHADMKVFGLTQVSNMAAGLSDQPLTHYDVLKATRGMKSQTASFLAQCISQF